MPGHDLVRVCNIVGTGQWGFEDGDLQEAMFTSINGLVQLPCGDVLFTDEHSNRLRLLHDNMQCVSTVAGGGFGSACGDQQERWIGNGDPRWHRDGAVSQARFRHPEEDLRVRGRDTHGEAGRQAQQAPPR